jgi:RNA polymerase primary sigma factor
MEELAYYNNIIEENPLLTSEEEKYWAECITKGKRNKQKAREKLFNSNIRLVISQASKKKMQAEHKHIPIEDLISGGFCGLLTAIDRFDPTISKLSTYAYPWITLHINNVIKDFNSNVKIPSNLLIQRKKVNNKKMDEDISDNDIMESLNLSSKEMRRIEATNITVLSLQSEAFSKDSSSQTLEELIEDEKQKGIVDSACESEEIELLKLHLDTMDAIRRDIVKSRHLHAETETLDSIGERYNLSKERIRQLEKSALDELKNFIKKKSRLNR